MMQYWNDGMASFGQFLNACGGVWFFRRRRLTLPVGRNFRFSSSLIRLFSSFAYCLLPIANYLFLAYCLLRALRVSSRLRIKLPKFSFPPCN
jgi:hypothetical protein